MKRFIFALFAISLLAASACSTGKSTESEVAPDMEGLVENQTLDGDLLDNYEWVLQSASDGSGSSVDALFVSEDEPVTLIFKDGRYSFLNTCNRLGGSYSIEGSDVVTSGSMSTRMACPDPKMEALDQAVSNRFSDARLRAALFVDGADAQLTLTNGTEAMVFHGKLVPRALYGEGVVEFYRVAPALVECEGVGQTTCLQVKKITYDDQGIATGEDEEWTTFYAPIEGYKHNDGVEEVIRVVRYTDPNPAADANKYVFYYDATVEASTTAEEATN